MDSKILRSRRQRSGKTRFGNSNRKKALRVDNEKPLGDDFLISFPHRVVGSMNRRPMQIAGADAKIPVETFLTSVTSSW